MNKKSLIYGIGLFVLGGIVGLVQQADNREEIKKEIAKQLEEKESK